MCVVRCSTVARAPISQWIFSVTSIPKQCYRGRIFFFCNKFIERKKCADQWAELWYPRKSYDSIVSNCILNLFYFCFAQFSTVFGEKSSTFLHFFFQFKIKKRGHNELRYHDIVKNWLITNESRSRRPRWVGPFENDGENMWHTCVVGVNTTAPLI